MLEAAAAGLPLIANWEENTNFHGAWRAPRDVFKMAEGLDHIMSNWELYRSSIYETSQNLSWESRTEDLLKIYNSLL
jgi:glycosyltransferase involved in cell wall biosynthesis